MKKTLITILIIVILVGAGYFAYTKGLINLDFLKKGEVVEDMAVIENQDKTLKIQEIDEIVKTLDQIDEYSVKILNRSDLRNSDPGDMSAIHQPAGSINFDVTGYIKDGKIYKISLDTLGENDNHPILQSNIDYYIYNDKLMYVANTGNYSWADDPINKVVHYFNNGSLLESKIIKQVENSTYIQDQEKLAVFHNDDYKTFMEAFSKTKEIGKISNESLDGKWSVKDFGWVMRDLGTVDEEAWMGRVLEIKNNVLHFDFAGITGDGNNFDFNKDEYCSILNIDKPEVGIDHLHSIGIKTYKTNCSPNNPFSEFSLDTNGEIKIWWDNVSFIITKDKISTEVKKPEVPTPPKTNTTTTYMCEGKVKIVRVQDSPSLPPRVSYLRTSDDVQVGSYGDFGAYIRPEYFSIDRKQIEQGYGFNETNFCKYLKN
jgi:hypothetical protein